MEITNLSVLIDLLSIPNSDFEFGENKLIRCVCWTWSAVIKSHLYETMWLKGDKWSLRVQVSWDVTLFHWFSGPDVLRALCSSEMAGNTVTADFHSWRAWVTLPELFCDSITEAMNCWCSTGLQFGYHAYSSKSPQKNYHFFFVTFLHNYAQCIFFLVSLIHCRFLISLL